MLSYAGGGCKCSHWVTARTRNGKSEETGRGHLDGGAYYLLSGRCWGCAPLKTDRVATALKESRHWVQAGTDKSLEG